MRKEYAYFDKEKKALAITNNKNDQVWCCVAYCKQFKDGVHQNEIWFREMPDDNIPFNIGPPTKEEWANLWMLDGGDMFELDCNFTEDGWYEGFCYGCKKRTELRHPCICFAEGLGPTRNLNICSISVID